MNIKTIGTAFVLFLGVLALSVSSASYGHVSTPGKMMQEASLMKSHKVCSSYLQPAIYSVPEATENVSMDTRSKSQAMAVGILFGARHAFGSNKGLGDSAKVQAIKNYRNCRKERAIQS